MITLGEDHGFIGVALAGSTISEIHQGRFVFIWVTRGTGTIKTNPHGITGGMEGMGANNERVQVKIIGLLRVPTTVGQTAQHPDDVNQV